MTNATPSAKIARSRVIDLPPPVAAADWKSATPAFALGSWLRGSGLDHGSPPRSSCPSGSIPPTIATNAATFLDQAEAVLGTRPLIIAGTEEGRLAYSGALSHLPAHEGITLVIDIGGGSTEIMIGEKTLQHAVSFPVGTVVLTESHLSHDPPRPEELTNAIGFVTDFMDDLIRDHPEVLSATRVVGVAGSIVTIAAVEIGLKEFDAAALHGARMTRENVEEVFRTLATETLANRKFNPGLPADRADVIVGGCCVLVGVMRKLRVSEIMVSVNNLLDGLVRDELGLS